MDDIADENESEFDSPIGIYAAGAFATVVSQISELGGDLVGIDMIESTADYTVRDLTITVLTSKGRCIVEKVKQIPGIRLIHVSDSVFMMHLGGKLEMQPKFPIKNREICQCGTPGGGQG